MDTKERFDPQDDIADELVELGTVSKDTRGFLLGLFHDAGAGRRLI